MTFTLTLFSLFVVIPTIHFPKIVFLLLCSWYSWRWKCGAVWGPCWIELTVSDYCDLILIWTKKPSNTHALSTSCPQINVTHSGMNGIIASLQHGATCWVVWLAGHTEIYVLTSQFCNVSCLNSHFLSQILLKWSLYQQICFTALFVIGVSELLQALKIWV